MSDPQNGHGGGEAGDGSKTSKPFHEGEDASGSESPGMAEAPHDRADAVGDAEKQAEMPKTTQRQE